MCLSERKQSGWASSTNGVQDKMKPLWFSGIFFFFLVLPVLLRVSLPNFSLRFVCFGYETPGQGCSLTHSHIVRNSLIDEQ